MEEEPTHLPARGESPAPDSDVRELIDLLAAVVWEADPRTLQFTFVSAGAERLLGYPVSQWVSETDFWTAHIHPDDRDQTTVLRRIALQQGRDQQFEYRMMAADGSVRWVRDLVSVQVNEAGETIRMSGLMVDLTEPRGVEEALRERELLFRTMYESSPLGVALWSSDGRILKANRAFADMLGFSLRELVAGATGVFVNDDDEHRMLEAREKLLTGKHTTEVFEQRYVHRDGSVVSTLVTLSLIQLPGQSERHFLSQLVDLTERKNLEAQHVHAQKMELLSRVAGGIAHDFNNLLTVIASSTERLSSLPSLRDEHRESLMEIQTAAAAAGDLTRQLTGLTRRQNASPAMLDLNRAISAFERLLRRAVGDEVDLFISVSTDALNVRVEPGNIEQIVLNLVLNARDAMPRGGRVTISTSAVRLYEPRILRTGVLAPAIYAKLEVRDTGTGMSDCMARQVFEPFFTTKEPGRGTGLGLATVDNIVRQCGGAMDVHSVPGRGTRFEVLLPRFEGVPIMRY